MISLVRAGKGVARIKGGDPFKFGRGGEELQVLRQAGISISVISGITSGMAVTASLNIPLTHRNSTHGVTFVTGHTQGSEEPNWQALAETGDSAWITADIPAAAIQNDTLPTQRQVVTTLGRLESWVVAEKMASPAIVVIGEVVRFAEMTEQISQQLAA